MAGRTLTTRFTIDPADTDRRYGPGRIRVGLMRVVRIGVRQRPSWRSAEFPAGRDDQS